MKTVRYLFLIVFSTNLMADIYVSQISGNDSNNGTLDYPFATISKAVTVVQSGDKVIIENGIYREKVTVGTDNITFFASGDSVYVTGADLVASWQAVSSSIYKAYLPDKCLQLFVNGSVHTKAKFPNQPITEDLFEFTTIPVTLNDSTVTSDSLTQTSGFWDGATIWMIVGKRWVAQTARVISSSSGQLSLSYISCDFTGDGIAYLTNSYKALDYEGEWCWQNDTLYHFTSENINELTVEAKTRKVLFDLTGCNGIVLDGINGYGGNILMDSTIGSTIKNGTFTYLNEYHYIDKETVSWYNSFSRSKWTNINSHGLGIAVFGNNNTIENCILTWSAGDCITLYGENNSVINSIVRNGNYLGTDCAPIALGGTGNRIVQCDVSDGGRGVITALSATGFTVKNNRLSGCGILNYDVGVFYTYDTDGTDSEIAFNWIFKAHDKNPASTEWGAHGIYFDNNSKNFIAHHNVIWDVKGDAIRFNSPAFRLKAYNNTIFSSSKMITFDNGVFTDTSGECEFINNYINAAVLQEDWITNTFNVSDSTDYLEDRPNLNFMPKTGSPLIDAGSSIPGITENAVGIPDIGAYEHSGDLWIPGALLDTTTVSITHEFKKTVIPGIRILQKGSLVQFVNNDGQEISIEIYSLNGRLLFQKNINKKVLMFNMHSLNIAKGCYFIKVIEKKNSHIKKILFKSDS